MPRTRFPARLLLSVLLWVVNPSALVWAEEGEGRQTRQTAALSQKVYEKLTEAQTMVESGQVEQGLAVLKSLEGNSRLTPYERAQLYNYLAYTYFTMERYRDAIGAYQQVLNQPDLPPALAQNSLYTLAQLYFTVEDYRAAVTTIERWFEVAEKPTDTAWLLLGQAYYQLGEYRAAIEPIDKAMAMARERGETPEERLFLIKRAAWFELGDYKNLVKVVRELVRLYPRTSHWMTLAGAYSQLGDTRRQMVIMEMLHESGELERPEQLRNLANLYLLHGAPYKAANLLQQQMDAGTLTADVGNLRLLAQCWQQAREDERALGPLSAAAEASKGGDLHVRLAQSYLNLGRYEDAVDALRTGIARGELSRPDQASVMLGLALFEIGRLGAAREAFADAAGDKRSRKTAEQWMAFIEAEVKRREALGAGSDT